MINIVNNDQINKVYYFKFHKTIIAHFRLSNFFRKVEKVEYPTFYKFKVESRNLIFSKKVEQKS